jgi:hypothetical protein
MSRRPENETALATTSSSQKGYPQSQAKEETCEGKFGIILFLNKGHG